MIATSPAIDRGAWMQTHTGRRFYPLDPHIEDIDIEDIAHALAHLCRFGGHCRTFYSVAQHSVIVSSYLPDDEPALQLAGLLHDATEAFLVDIPRPLKVALPEYKAIEQRLEAVIAERFGVDFHDQRIKQADNVALMTEARDLMGTPPAGWASDVPEGPDRVIINPWAPDQSRQTFLSVYRHLCL
jgi:hypothetical protein